ncbi:MAG: class I SAM-dependent methyltransferase [Candidatus Eisenbacteria sp.]|nr:class I SAM-dependent methyltransferase [Candidatus Eisenbacteria bacterium]
MTVVTYGETENNRGAFELLVKGLIERHSLRAVCEVGAGAKPLLEDEYVREHGLDCTLFDASEEELQEASSSCRTVVGDICAYDADNLGPFDLIYSRSVAEHIRRGDLFHKKIRDLLVDDGFACHLFPTLYALPFVVNVLIPEQVSTFGKSLLIHGRWRSKHKKFPAYYSWCRGPSERQITRLTELGYDVLEYTGFFGHEQYYNHLPLLRKVHRHLKRVLVRHPSPHLTSFGMVALRKRPDDPGSTPSA